jgi:hypothetical protein
MGVASDETGSYRKALESITDRRLGEFVDYVAHDAFEGRLAGSRGARAVAEFLAGQLKHLKLTPAGSGGDYMQPFGSGYRNVLGLLEGRDSTLKDQVIVVGGHYDHVGYGSSRTSRGPVGYIHNGADDNASGTSAVLKLAEAFSLLDERPKRSILFAFWDAEEIGLLGAKHWLSQPTIRLDRVRLAVDIDMIGRLRDDRLMVFGTRTTYGLRRLLSEESDESNLRLDFSWTIKPNGDHYPFFSHNIPVLLFHTGEHEDYHRPSDKADRINRVGMQRVTRLAFQTICELADRDDPIRFREASRTEKPNDERALLEPSQPADRLGALWMSEQGSQNGVVLTWVYPGTPADKALLRSGDRIVRFAGHDIRHGQDLTNLLPTAQNPVPIVIRRSGSDEPLPLTVQLAGNPVRLGITWRVDDAEPDSVLLTHVLPGSPAAQAGLQTGDRVLRIGSHRFDNEEKFALLARTLPGPLEFVIERNGQLLHKTIQLPIATKRAA